MIVIVVDGMGGYWVGDVVSEMVVCLLSDVWKEMIVFLIVEEIEIWL